MNTAEIRNTCKTILLVDWPDTRVPRALLAAGFTVFCYSPGKYTEALLVEELPQNVEGLSVFPPKNDDEKGHLVFSELAEPPASVDIVNIYRPEEEHATIIANHALPLGAKVVWRQPPLVSATTRKLAEENGLLFVEGVGVGEWAGKN